MLNRRILRIKAMQSLYAFQKSEESNYHLAIARIEEDYRNLLLNKGVEFKFTLHEHEQESVKLFQSMYKEQKAYERVETDPVYIGKYALEAASFYKNQGAQEYRVALNKMISETEMLFTKYLRMLQLVVTLADRLKKVQRDREESRHNINALFDCTRFFEAELIDTLRNNADVTRENFHWDADLIATWATSLRKDEAFQKLLAESGEGREADVELVLYVIRDFMFSHDAVQSHFEEDDMNWLENRSILRSMLSKTIKSVLEGEMEVLSLSRNWEDDRDFFKKLFEVTVEKDSDWEVRIANRTKKWSSDRIATVDKILLKMAMSEMVAFPSIPVKVTINEYIEISKVYSTPKSWQFMNGVLDAIAGDMQEEGVIRKSGRGLLDNK